MPKTVSFCLKCTMLVFPDGTAFHELICPFNSPKIKEGAFSISTVDVRDLTDEKREIRSELKSLEVGR